MTTYRRWRGDDRRCIPCHFVIFHEVMELRTGRHSTHPVGRGIETSHYYLPWRLLLAWHKRDISHLIFFVYQEHDCIVFGSMREPLLNERLYFIRLLMAVFSLGGSKGPRPFRVFLGIRRVLAPACVDTEDVPYRAETCGAREYGDRS
jgi:hypothetical protein